jgi:hypothetical protein
MAAPATPIYTYTASNAAPVLSALAAQHVPAQDPTIGTRLMLDANLHAALAFAGAGWPQVGTGQMVASVPANPGLFTVGPSSTAYASRSSSTRRAPPIGPRRGWRTSATQDTRPSHRSSTSSPRRTTARRTSLLRVKARYSRAWERSGTCSCSTLTNPSMCGCIQPPTPLLLASASRTMEYLARFSDQGDGGGLHFI